MMTFAFYLFALSVVVSGFMVVISRNPVHSVLWLILAFFSAAGARLGAPGLRSAQTSSFLASGDTLKPLKPPANRVTWRAGPPVTGIAQTAPSPPPLSEVK